MEQILSFWRCAAPPAPVVWPLCFDRMLQAVNRNRRLALTSPASTDLSRPARIRRRDGAAGFV
jgi:hypothetical protein